MDTKIKINWADQKFDAFRNWLFEKYDISLTPNKNSFQVHSPGEYRPTMPVSIHKIFLYARTYYTDPSNIAPNNDVTDPIYLNWWYTGQEIWPTIKNAFIHDDITDLVYFMQEWKYL